MGGRAVLLGFTGAIIACGPAVTVSDASGGSTTERADTVTATGQDSDMGGMPSDPCLLASPDDCPEGCLPAPAYEGCSGEPITICVAAGAPYEGRPTTHWISGAETPLFVEVGDPCGVSFVPGGDWAECSGAVGEADGCACFCQRGWCMGDEDRRVLEDCGLEFACGQMVIHPEVGAADYATAVCVLEGLRDRIPGVYELVFLDAEEVAAARIYLQEELVQRIELETSDDDLSCPRISRWSGAERCSLPSSEYFDACLNGPFQMDQCAIEAAEWLMRCIPTAPACTH